MICVENLEFSYPDGEFTLQIPSLKIGQGERTAVVGPSGSGKTTFFNLLSGVALPSRGRIVISGIQVSRLSDAERRHFRIRTVGMVFQEFELLEYLSVLDNILLPYRITDALSMSQSVRERAAELAQRAGIGDKLHRFVGRLSQGERQRVGICRALLPSPPVLLADEPTGSLDPANKQKILEILLQTADDHHATLLTVTHDHELLTYFNRIVDFRHFYAKAAGNGKQGAAP